MISRLCGKAPEERETEHFEKTEGAEVAGNFEGLRHKQER